MGFSLDVIRAHEGDCLILHYGTQADPKLIMIDGGPANTYEPDLKSRIAGIRAARGLGPTQPLPVEILMVSHVDEDHILGILDLAGELRTLKEEMRPLPLRVATLWHNSFENILNRPPDELARAPGFGVASLGGAPEAEDEDEDEAEVRADVAKILASVGQGSELRAAAEFLNWPLNRQFDGKLVRADAQPTEVSLDPGLKLTVVGPAQAELEELWKVHNKWLKTRKTKPKEAAALAAYLDESEANLSSIVVVAEAGGKRMLLTGDARGDKVLKGLEGAGLLDAPDGKMHVDLLKVPHHGSARNLDRDFFRRITADRYVFTGDGKHGNPERESLEMLFAERPDAPFTLYFAYPIDEIDVGREDDWEKEQRRETDNSAKAVAKGKPPKPVRPDWSAEHHSLAAFLAERGVPSAKQAIVIVPKGPGFHAIDLL